MSGNYSMLATSRFIANEIKRWSDVVRKANISLATQ